MTWLECRSGYTTVIVASVAIGCASPPRAVAVGRCNRPGAWHVEWMTPTVSCDEEWFPPTLTRDRRALTDVCARYDVASGVATRTADSEETPSPAANSNATSARSRNGSRELTIGPGDDVSETVEITDLANRHVLCTRRFLDPVHPHSAATLADGRLAVFTSQHCRRVARDADGNAPGMECVQSGLFAVSDDCGLEAVIDDVTLRDAVVTPDGRGAVLIRHDGRTQFVRLPGTVVAELPALARADHTRPESIAATDAGAVAVASDAGTAVFVRDGSRYTKVYASDERTAARTFFLQDGNAAVFAGVDKITLVRSGSPRRWPSLLAQ